MLATINSTARWITTETSGCSGTRDYMIDRPMDLIDIASDDGLLKGGSVRFFVDEGYDIPENRMDRAVEEERKTP